MQSEDGNTEKLNNDDDDEGVRSLRPLPTNSYSVINNVEIENIGSMPIFKGDLRQLPVKVQRFVIEKAYLMRPRGIYICDGSSREADEIVSKLVDCGTFSVLTAYENNYICRTNQMDVQESISWTVTPGKYQTLCHTNNDSVTSIMSNWMSPSQCGKELDNRFPGCMKGRIMYVIPFSLGAINGRYSKIGIELTDSEYAVLCMRIITRVSMRVFEALGDRDFIRCVHSVGVPLSGSDENSENPSIRKDMVCWPCNPTKAFLVHRPCEREIWSFGSGFGTNSLLGRKSMGLRIASSIARDEGWLAEHMAVFSVVDPKRREHFIAAAFPAACGKTSLAMLRPSLPGWKIRCIGDDIAWLRIGEGGRLYAVNPEFGFFGIAPGLSKRTNSAVMTMLRKNSIFTNVAETSNGEFFWQGLEDEVKDKNVEIEDWTGSKWHIGDKSRPAHYNARYIAPASQCPLMHHKWESSKGVPIDAILFGSRRPRGVPLVYETFSWQHGVFTGACLKSEVYSDGGANKVIFHDPMAMSNYLSYNFGDYLQHWLNFGKNHHYKLPRIYHVNWYRQGDNGELLWPGYGENVRVLEWIIRRINGDQQCGRETAIGVVPFEGYLLLDGLEDVRFDDLMSVPKQYWQEDASETRSFLCDQLGDDMPVVIREQMDRQEKRIETLIS